MIIDLAVAEKGEEAIDLVVGDGFPEPYTVNVRDGNQHGRVIGNDTQMKEAACGTKNGFFFDPFDDTEPVVRVDDLVADLECHVSPVAGRLVVGPDARRVLHPQV